MPGAHINVEATNIMWVIVSSEYCVVQHGGEYFVCRRERNGKLERLQICRSYQEAYDAYREVSERGQLSVANG
jgi:hypothetical protein